MTNKKIILEELGRMRELMGFNGISKSRINEIKRLISEGDGTKGIIDEIIPGGAKTMDNLGKLSKTVDDLFTYSTRLSELAPTKSFDDFLAVVSRKNNNQEVTADMLRSFIASDAKLADELMGAASKISEEAVERLMQDVKFTDVFVKAGIPDLPETMKGVLAVKIDSGSVGQVKAGLDSMEDLIINTNLKDTDEGKELLAQIAGKRKQIGDYEDFQTKKSSPTPKPSDDFPEPEDLIKDDVAEEITSNPQSTINEMFDAIIQNRKLRRSIAPGLKTEDFEIIRGRLIAKYGNVSMETLVSKYEVMKADALVFLKNAQKVVDDANKGIVKEGTDPNKYRVAKNIGNFLIDNKFTRACFGTDGKNSSEVGFKGAAYKIPMCALGILFASDMVVWALKPKNERDFVGCNLLGVLGGCQYFTRYGFCESACSESTEPIFEKVWNDTDKDFALWVAENGGTLPGKDGSGRFYTDKDGTKQYVTHDPAKRTFINAGTTPPPPPPPKPGTCVWKSDADAKAALKKTFTSAEDADITVDLANCKVTYKNPILKTSSTYGPTDL